MSARRSITTALVTMFMVSMFMVSSWELMLGSQPALAGKFKLSSSFGGAGTGSGQFETPHGVAVEASTGDVFVVDTGNKRVEKFNPTGTKVESELAGAGTPPPEFNEEPLGVAVDNAGDVYVAVSAELSEEFAVDRFKPKGTSGNEPNEYEYECQFTGPERGCFTDPETEGGSGEKFGEGQAVATDSNGNVYIAAKHSVYEFEADGASVATLAKVTFSTVGVTVSGNDVYVITFAPGTSKFELVKLVVNPATHAVEAESVLDTEDAHAVTVDPGGNVYVVDDLGASEGGPHVAKYDATGKFAAEFGAGEIGESAGIAYSPFNKEIYVSDLEHNNVHILEEVPGPPVAATGTATEVAATSARLNGAVNPEGFETTSLFEYGASGLYGSSTPALVVGSEPPSSHDGSGGVSVEVTARLSGLEPNETYHYQLVGTSTLPGSGSGGDQTFKTLAALPTVNDQPPAASSITRTAAQLSGTVNPKHSETTYHFEDVEEAGYNPVATNPYSAGGRTLPASAGEGFGDQTVAQQLTSLLAGTTYHYRLSATNQAGTVTGPDHTFTTASGTPPVASTGAPSSVTQTAATISGTVDPQGIQTSYELELGTNTSYSGAKIFGSAGETVGAETITLALQNLAPGTTYHYRIAATNADGTAYGADQSFTTPSYPSPITLPLTAPPIMTPSIALPTETGTSTTIAKKALTRSQKLAAALRTCRMKSKGKRAACRKRARRQYAPVERDPARHRGARHVRR
jgi:sugar lactone lactonase YvrE